MLGEIESSAFHSEIINRFHNLFPNVVVSSNTPKHSVFESIDKLVTNLPMPTNYETGMTLSNMKSVVDGQQLRIQLGMMQNEDNQICDINMMHKKSSNKTQQGNWDSNLGIQGPQWAWNQDSLKSEHFCNEFYSFID